MKAPLGFLTKAASGFLSGVGIDLGGDATDGVIGQTLQIVYSRLADESQQLPRALREAYDRAWKTLHIALQGENWWNKVLDKKDLRQLAGEFRRFWNTQDALLGAHSEDFRRDCLRELRQARKAGLLSWDEFRVDDLAGQVRQALDRFGDATGLVQRQRDEIAGIADALEAENLPRLAALLRLEYQQGSSLLVVAFEYHLQSALQEDQELHRRLVFDHLRHLSQEQLRGLESLRTVFGSLAAKLDDMREAVADTNQQARRTNQLVKKIARQLNDFKHKVDQLLQERDLKHRPLRPGDSDSVTESPLKHKVRAAVAEFDSLPPKVRARFPELLNDVGKLKVLIGEMASAERDFDTAANRTQDPRLRAEARYHAFRAALDQGEWPKALEELREVLAAGDDRFLLFPREKYLPERVLGAGANGVAILCQDRDTRKKVVVKALHVDDPNKVFQEAITLQKLNHPGIIHILHCDFTVRPENRNPYLVLEYMGGESLEEYVKHHGPLTVEADLVAIARQMADAFRAAHAEGIIHRDVKPGNVLVVRQDSGQWVVKLIDFGLALDVQGKTGVQAGRSRVGTLHYAAPEQLGEIPGIAVGTYSDVYSFARTCCYALFQNVLPTMLDWPAWLSASLVGLLNECLQWHPDRRLQNFNEVLERLPVPAQDVRPLVNTPPRVETPGDVTPDMLMDAAPSPHNVNATCFWLAGPGLVLLELSQASPRRLYVRCVPHGPAPPHLAGEVPPRAKQTLFRLPPSCGRSFTLQLLGERHGEPLFSQSFHAGPTFRVWSAGPRIHRQADQAWPDLRMLLYRDGRLIPTAPRTPPNPLPVKREFRDGTELLFTPVSPRHQGPTEFVRFLPLRLKVQVDFLHEIDPDVDERFLRVQARHLNPGDSGPRPDACLVYHSYREQTTTRWPMKNWRTDGFHDAPFYQVETRDTVEVEFLTPLPVEVSARVATFDGIQRALPGPRYQYLGALESHTLAPGGVVFAEEAAPVDSIAALPGPVQDHLRRLQNDRPGALDVALGLLAPGQAPEAAMACLLEHPQLVQLLVSDRRLAKLAARAGLPAERAWTTSVDLLLHAVTGGQNDFRLRSFLEQLPEEVLAHCLEAVPDQLEEIWMHRDQPGADLARFFQDRIVRGRGVRT